MGWCFPNAVMQGVVPDVEHLSISRTALQRRRDRLMRTLEDAGYAPLLPEGTFYLWSRWPHDDPVRAWNDLADHDVFVMPGSTMNAPAHFRISLTASDEMVDRALPVFAAITNSRT
jgi:aspartate aminotransferase